MEVSLFLNLPCLKALSPYEPMNTGEGEAGGVTSKEASGREVAREALVLGGSCGATAESRGPGGWGGSQSHRYSRVTGLTEVTLTPQPRR